MKIEDLIKIADEAYPDGMIQDAYDALGNKENGRVGDTLAEFIARELCETFDEDASDYEQLTEASRVMHMAMNEIESVYEAFEAKPSEMGLTYEPRKKEASQ